MPIPEGVETRKGTCEVCRKVRKLGRFERWYWRCAECYDLSSAEAEKIRKVAYSVRKGPRFAYPCIGGPLDGQYATTEDFYQGWHETPDGMYAHLRHDYSEFNAGHGGNKRIGGTPTMVFIHKTLLKPLISPRNR